ncbi:MAG: hypothetical protein AAGB34_04305 [Planctomycetota bacterium]
MAKTWDTKVDVVAPAIRIRDEEGRVVGSYPAPKYLNRTESAELCGFGDNKRPEESFDEFRFEKKIPGAKVGRRVLFRTSDLVKAIEHEFRREPS